MVYVNFTFTLPSLYGHKPSLYLHLFPQNQPFFARNREPSGENCDARSKNSDKSSENSDKSSKISDARSEHRGPPYEHREPLYNDREPPCDQKWHIYHQEMIHFPSANDILFISKMKFSRCSFSSGRVVPSYPFRAPLYVRYTVV